MRNGVDYDRAMRIDDDVAEALLLRATQRIRQKDPAGATADLTRAQQLAPDLTPRVKILLDSILGN